MTDHGGPTGPAWFDALAIVAILSPLFARRRFPFGAPVAVGVAVVVTTFAVPGSDHLGIATSVDRSSAGDLLRDADVALYRAKAAGKNCSIMFGN